MSRLDGIMTKTARTLLNKSFGTNNAYAIVSEEIMNITHEVENNYQKETSIFTFEDGSMISMCSSDFSIKIVYNSTLPMWAK